MEKKREADVRDKKKNFFFGYVFIIELFEEAKNVSRERNTCSLSPKSGDDRQS